MKTKSEVERRFTHLLELKYSDSTVRSYVKYVGEFLDWCDNVPTRVTNEDFLDYNIHIRNKSYSYRNGAINAIKQYFKLYLRKSIKKNIAIRPAKQKRVVKSLDWGFVENKVLGVVNLKHRLCLMFGFYLGLRSNEVLCLKISDVDIERGFVLVNGKGNKQREVPLHPDMIGLLIGYVDEYNPKEYLFNGAGNRLQYSATSLLQLVKNYIGNFTFHQLRHTCLQNIFNETNDIYSVKEMAGHSHIKTSIESYANVTLNHLIKIQKKTLKNKVKRNKISILQ